MTIFWLSFGYLLVMEPSTYIQMGKKNDSGVKAVWNEHNIPIFCDLCIKEVEAGRRPTTHFEKEGWESLRINFAKETGQELSKSQLKNKWDVLKEQWKYWKELKGKETGLGWNPKLGTVDASNDWWQSKIQKNKKYAQFRKNGISPDMEQKLDRMFMNTVATGQHAWAPSSGVLPSENQEASNGDDIALEGSGDSDDTTHTMETTQVTESSSGKGKRKATEEKKDKGTFTRRGKVGGAAKLSQQIDRMVDAIETRSTATSVMHATSQASSIPEVMKVVSSLPGAEAGSSLWLYATELFMSQPRGSREIFNHAHSSLRSVIERTFGVWKRRWKILRDMPNYSFTKQVKIVIATMALHNYIRRHANRDIHFNESEDDPNDIVSEEADQIEDYHITQGSGAQEMEQLRNNIATSLIRASI